MADQLESHWADTAPRPRLDGLTDDEYFWEPAGCWTVIPTARSTRSAPDRPVHHDRVAARPCLVYVLALRPHSHYADPPADYLGVRRRAATALSQLDAPSGRGSRVCAAPT